MMTKGTNSPYFTGENDFYSGVPMSQCPYDREFANSAYQDWMLGWRDSFIEFVHEMDDIDRKLEEDLDDWLPF